MASTKFFPAQRHSSRRPNISRLYTQQYRRRKTARRTPQGQALPHPVVTSVSEIASPRTVHSGISPQSCTVVLHRLFKRQLTSDIRFLSCKTPSSSWRSCLCAILLGRMLESKSQHPQPPLLLLSLRDPRTRNRPSFLDLSIYMEYSPTVATCLRHFSASDVMCQGTNSCMVVGTKLRGG